MQELADETEALRVSHAAEAAAREAQEAARAEADAEAEAAAEAARAAAAAEMQELAEERHVTEMEAARVSHERAVADLQSAAASAIMKQLEAAAEEAEAEVAAAAAEAAEVEAEQEPCSCVASGSRMSYLSPPAVREHTSRNRSLSLRGLRPRARAAVNTESSRSSAATRQPSHTSKGTSEPPGQRSVQKPLCARLRAAVETQSAALTSASCGTGTKARRSGSSSAGTLLLSQVTGPEPNSSRKSHRSSGQASSSTNASSIRDARCAGRVSWWRDQEATRKKS